MHARNQKLERIVYSAILIAISYLLSFLPIRIGPIEMTLCMLPTILAAILLGPVGGAVVGASFGLFSFCQCFAGLGLPLSAFGAFIFASRPFATFLICVVSRVLMGLLTGFLFRAFSKTEERTKGIIPYLVSNLSGALMNTVFFTGSVLLFFWRDASFIGKMQEWKMPTGNVWLFVAAFVGINGLVEALICSVAGTTVSKTVHFAVRRMH